jgi:alpha-beta hydrolase superfamily lysophospholipase
MPDTESARDVSEQRLTLAVSGIDIPAALTLPPGATAGTTLPAAALLVPGSLFADVNGDFPAWNVFPHVYAHLARQLSARGLAVYRFAKLGPGTGSTIVDAAAAETVRNWAGRRVIATAALAAMRDALRAAGISVQRIVLAGHSEGSVVVSQLAAGDSAGATAVDGVVLLAGPSVGILGIMQEQAPNFMVEPEQRELAQQAIDRAVAHVRRGESIPDDVKALPGVQGLARMDEAGLRYMRECDATDPLDLAARITQPVLIVQGGRDSSVPTHHGERLREARGSRPTTYAFFEELQHMFKPLPPGLPPMEAFGLAGETDPRLADAMAGWVQTVPLRAPAS